MRSQLREKLRSVDGSRLPLEETLKAMAIPPVTYNKVPRVEHFLANSTGRACPVVAEALDLPQSFVKQLIDFGAVYSCPIVPDTAKTMQLDPQIRSELQSLREKSISRFGRHPSLRNPRRLTQQDVVTEDSYCRVHVHPKRFPAYYIYDWTQRLVYENSCCVVVNKPPGCQVVPRVDNQVECLTAWMQKVCGLESELKPVHRLDTGTEGIVVLAKTSAFARYFQRLLKENKLQKEYTALTVRPPPLGPLVHYIEHNHHTKGQPRRSKIYSEPTGNAAYAELEITSTERVTLSDSASSEWGVAEAFESTIVLKTGRTHQIRIQLAECGCPILGDGLYSPDPDLERRAYRCHDGRDNWIGLQASLLRINSPDSNFLDKSEFKAGRPLWRRSA